MTTETYLARPPWRATSPSAWRESAPRPENLDATSPPSAVRGDWPAGSDTQGAKVRMDHTRMSLRSCRLHASLVRTTCLHHTGGRPGPRPQEGHRLGQRNVGL